MPFTKRLSRACIVLMGMLISSCLTSAWAESSGPYIPRGSLTLALAPAPGSYRFRVVAPSGDGVRNNQGAVLQVVVPSTILQSTWLKLLCLIAVIVVAVALYRLRLRLALRRMETAFEHRVAERERIARELHDTLLQSVHGLILAFRRIALRTPEDAPTKPMMETALQQAIDVMAEGRDKVMGLRDAGGQRELGEMLRSHGGQRGENETARFRLRQLGEVRPLHAAVQEEAFAIGREAINNAFTHSGAGLIEVILSYGERYLELLVRDDGAGLSADLDATIKGRWGIVGMRERAAQSGALLKLESAPGGGTTWTLRFDARIAYTAGGPESAFARGKEDEHAIG